MQPPPRTWLGKFADAFRGFFLSVRTQSSFVAHIPVAVACVTLAAWLGITAVEWCLVILAIGLVIMALVVGATALVSRSVGKGRLAVARTVIGQTCTLAVVAGLIVGLGALTASSAEGGVRTAQPTSRSPKPTRAACPVNHR